MTKLKKNSTNQLNQDFWIRVWQFVLNPQRFFLFLILLNYKFINIKNLNNLIKKKLKPKINQCLELIFSNSGSILPDNDLEGIITSCIKSVDGSNYYLRVAVASLLASILASTQNSQPDASQMTPDAKKGPKRASSVKLSLTAEEMLSQISSHLVKSVGFV